MFCGYKKKAVPLQRYENYGLHTKRISQAKPSNHQSNVGARFWGFLLHA